MRGVAIRMQVLQVVLVAAQVCSNAVPLQQRLQRMPDFWVLILYPSRLDDSNKY